MGLQFLSLSRVVILFGPHSASESDRKDATADLWVSNTFSIR